MMKMALICISLLGSVYCIKIQCQQPPPRYAYVPAGTNGALLRRVRLGQPSPLTLATMPSAAVQCSLSATHHKAVKKQVKEQSPCMSMCCIRCLRVIFDKIFPDQK